MKNQYLARKVDQNQNTITDIIDELVKELEHFEGES